MQFKNELTTKIKKAYPNVSRGIVAYNAERGPYCVGGALCKYVYDLKSGLYPFDFPLPSEIADRLVYLNPKLDLCKARNFAWDIITLNDSNNIKAAWFKLDEALNYGS